MLFLKYLVCVGTALAALLYGCCEYLGPAAAPARAGLSRMRSAEVFRPTPAPPIVAVEQMQPMEAAAEMVEQNQFSKSHPQTTEQGRAQVHKHKTRVATARQQFAVNSYAYGRSEQSFLRTRRPPAATMRNDP